MAVARLRPAKLDASGVEPIDRLIELVRTRSLLRGQPMRLASGAETTFYFNMKATTFHPEGSALIAEMLLSELAKDEATLIGGLEIGAVPMIACVAQRCWLSRHSSAIQGFFVRKAVKEYGTRKLVEGLPERFPMKGARALIVDDVTTTGGSVLKAVEVAREAGAEVRTVVTVVDRLEGAENNLAGHGLRLVALTTARDYGISA